MPTSRQTLWLWLGFFVIVAILLRVQRTMFAHGNLGGRRTIAWFVLGLAFVGMMYPLYEFEWLGAKLEEPSDSPGADAAMMYVSAYLMEYALSFDMAFVMSFACREYRVPMHVRSRVIFWGMIGSVLVRLVILGGASHLLRAFAWLSYLFGVLALVSFLSALRNKQARVVKPSDAGETTGQVKGRVSGILSRSGRLTERKYDQELLVAERGRMTLTLAGACVLVIVVWDILFALDSIAVLSVTKTTFVAVTSNVIAVIAQRSWIFTKSLERIRYPLISTALLLGIAGVKLLTYRHVHVPHVVWLATIAGVVLLGGVEASLWSNQRTG